MNIYKENYKDIINLQHHVSIKYPKMSLKNRSAQFAPFAALTGYDDAVKKTERVIEKKIEISEEVKAILDKKIQKIQDNINKKPKVNITYFLPDFNNTEGKYVNVESNVIKIDQYKKTVILQNEIKIPINDIINIDFISIR